jgi:hypothetical protein
VPITERLQRLRQSDIVEPLELASHFNFAAVHLPTLVQELLAVAERRSCSVRIVELRLGLLAFYNFGALYAIDVF